MQAQNKLPHIHFRNISDRNRARFNASIKAMGLCDATTAPSEGNSANTIAHVSTVRANADILTDIICMGIVVEKICETEL